MAVARRAAVVITAVVLAAAFFVPCAASVRLPKYFGSVPVVNEHSNMRFGYSLAANSRYLAVGVPFADGDGRVDVFAVDQPVGLTLIATVTASLGNSAQLGTSVSLDEANLLTVGANLFTGYPGEVLTYTMNDTGVEFVAGASNPTNETIGYFGLSMSSINGTRLIVGAYTNDIGLSPNAGIVYFYGVDAANGTQLDLQCTLLSPDPREYEFFGHSIATAGSWAAVGTPNYLGDYLAQGAVHLYKINNTDGCPTLVGTTIEPTPSASSKFGNSIAMASNGLVVVGAGGSDAAYLFIINSTSPGGLEFLADLIPLPGGSGILDADYGSLVFVNAAGLVVVCAPETNVGNSENAGAAYVFSVNVTTRTVLPVGGPLLRPDFSRDEDFGFSAAVVGDMVFVGSYKASVGEVFIRGDVSGFSMALPVNHLIVDGSFCAEHAVANYSGDCIAAAVAEAERMPGAISSIALEPGVYTGCLPGGVSIGRSDLVVTSTSFPALPTPADGLDVIWTCGNEAGSRHLRITGASNITFAGIGFVGGALGEGDGGIALVESSTDISFQGCLFANTTVDGHGGAIASVDSSVLVADSVAINMSATGNGGFVFSTGNSSLDLIGSNVTVASGLLGGAVYMEDGTVTESSFFGCSAKFGGAIYATASDGSLTVSNVTIMSSSATVSGGGIFVDAGNPDLASLTIIDTVVKNATASAVGGGVAVRAARLVEAPGTRTVDLVRVDVFNCTAKRGGGVFSEVDTNLVDSRIRSNDASESGGGAAFQPSPCAAASVSVVGTSFAFNQAQLDGGGLYSLSTSIGVFDSIFEGNSASRNGAGIDLDCAAEICVGEVPRDTCQVVAANLTGSVFARNDADGDGGGVHLSNRALALATAVGTSFVGNFAIRGAAVFSAAGGYVSVNGLSGTSARDVLASLGADMNVATAYGALLASPPSFLTWVDPPVGGVTMPGDNLCADGDGCLITMGDDYGNTPTTPTVVSVIATGAAVHGPQFVLVAGGMSEAIPDLSVRLFGESELVLPPIESAVGVALQFVDGDDTSHDAVSLTATQCAAGFGMATAGNEVWCEPCESGFYSDAADWSACEPCAVGRATDPGSLAAAVCDWCDVGYGWDGAGGCLPCAAGTFSSEVAFEAGCEPCVSGLTTSGDGANACAVVVASGGSTPWWVWLLIGVAVVMVVAIVGVVAWRSSRRKVISHYYIDEDATVTIDDKLLARKINAMLQDGFAKRIGGGEFTDIYRVREKKDVFVLKLLKVNLEGSGTARAEFDSEARILAQLQARVHPGIVRARFFTSSSPVCIGLDYCAGGTLKDHLARAGIPPKDKLMFATQIASSMAYVHSKGIAHLDLKTTNILLTAGKRSAVIADFGISQTSATSEVGTVRNPVFDTGGGVPMAALGQVPRGLAAAVALTPHYCAPERLVRKDLSFDELLASDIYTYGVVVWVIYAQVEPFAGMSGDEVVAAIKSDPLARHDIPDWVDHVARGVIERCWAPDGGERPSFAEISHVLRDRYCGDEVGGDEEEVYF